MLQRSLHYNSARIANQYLFVTSSRGDNRFILRIGGGPRLQNRIFKRYFTVYEHQIYSHSQDVFFHL